MRITVSIAPIDQPGMQGWAVYVNGVHVETHHARADAVKSGQAFLERGL